MDELLLAADVLEKTAHYLEALESEQAAVTTAARTKVAEDIKTRVAEAIGETLSDDAAAKLASSDADILQLIEKLAGSSQAPDSLGGPGEAQDTTTAPTTKKEAAAAADNQFVAWLSS